MSEDYGAKKAICSGFKAGYCWSTGRPHTGHYRTKREAIAAAKKALRKSASAPATKEKKDG